MIGDGISNVCILSFYYIGLNQGDIKNKYMEHLALWHDGRFAQCVYFLTALMNMLQRHHVAREVRGRIMNSSRVQTTLADQVFKPDFKVRIQDAIKNPDGKEGKEIRKMLEQIILLGSSNCPFSPGERRSIQPKLFANNFFFGVPNFFNTIAPDHFFAPLLLRETINPVHGNVIVPTLSEYLKRIITIITIDFQIVHLLE
jgi:hypothetical protein